MEYNNSMLLKKNIIKEEIQNYKNCFIDEKLLKIESNQIKSRKRVNEHGEVLTPKWLANSMLDILPQNIEKISTRYLETSAGEGIFLVEILKRKLELVFQNYQKRKDIEFYTLLAISNIYGLELLSDNVEIIKKNLLFLIKIYFKEKFKIPFSKKFSASTKKIINFNIINIDSIECKTPIFDRKNQILLDKEGNVIYKNEITRISEWKFNIKKKSITQIEYYYKAVVDEQKHKYMLKNNERNEEKVIHNEKIGQINLFNKIDYAEKKECIVKKAIPIKIWSNINYLELAEVK